MDLQTRVYKFYSEACSSETVSLNTAILVWQASYGYISPSITMNWMAIAQDNEYIYLGDIDIQNKFALGIYVMDGGDETYRLLFSGDQAPGSVLFQDNDHLELSGDQNG